jgi:hypothetical protein
MNKQTFAIAALALGAVLASVPAMAQNAARNPDDGGLIQAQQGDYYAPQTSTPRSNAPAYYGRPLDDGGMVPEPSGQQRLYNSARNRTSNAPGHLGRPLNDGGSQ